MADVIDVLYGTLYPRLKKWLERWTDHIKICENCLSNARNDALPVSMQYTEDSPNCYSMQQEFKQWR
ncbi:unnamed protein product [Dicrocoelium dendriticum]|nr:unnamed protein product [Dicrocoelium dendriticum]